MPERLENSSSPEQVLGTAQKQFDNATNPELWAAPKGIVVATDQFIAAMRMLDGTNARHVAMAYGALERFWREMSNWAGQNSEQPAAVNLGLDMARKELNNFFRPYPSSESGNPIILESLIERAKYLQTCMVLGGVDIE